MGSFLCQIGFHSWREVTRSKQTMEVVEVCRRGCGARLVNGERDDVR